jgi:hypothetical protein
LALALAHGQDPASVPRTVPTAGAAASFVYRSFDPSAPVHQPSREQQQSLAQAFPDALLFFFAKTPSQTERDFKWLGSYRYGILHLGGGNAQQLRALCESASDLLGWPVPYADAQPNFVERHGGQFAV